jgi:hypothetical protein
MTTTDLDLELDQLRAAVAHIGANLVAVEQDPTVALLDVADLGGDSARARRGRRRPAGLSLLPDIHIDVRYVTTEYGLVQGRWWMPTLTAVDATLTAGSFGAVPVRFERSYAEYQVEGAPAAAPGAPAPQPVLRTSAQALADDSARELRNVEVHLPDDTASLALSAELPPPLTPNTPLLSGRESAALAHEVERVAADPWLFTRPDFRRTPLLLRFNRVEGLSVGMRGKVDLGALSADATLRVATATGQPWGEVGVRRESAARRLRLAGYHRLAAANPLESPLGLSNSLGALLWGRDNGEFFRATGVELLGGPPRSQRPWLDWRLFAEHQGPVATETSASLRDAFGDFEFRPNFAADRADQAGLALTLRPALDRPLLGMNVSAALEAEGATGTFRYARPALTLRGARAAGGLAAAVEAAAGTSFGEVPAQSLWRVGGPGTLRGYDGGTAAGTAFWRARGELGTGSGAARVALFSDLGWAGAREQFGNSHALWSAGVGTSILDGLLRADLARVLRAPPGWRLELYMDGVL